MNKARLVTILIIAAGAVGFFVWLTGSYVLESQAGEDKVDIQVAPADGAAPEEISFIVKPQDAAQLVSGADLYVDVENGTIDSWEDCRTLEDSGTQFTNLVSETGSSARNGCVVFDSSDKLPGDIVLTAKVSCSGSEPMRIKINQTSTQVTGPVEDAQYSMGTIAEAEFSCDGTSPLDPTADIKATFVPDSCTGEVGDSCDYTLKVESQNAPKKISGVYVKIGFDSNVLQLDDFGNKQTVLGSQTLAQTVTCRSNADCLAACPSTNTCQAKCNIPAGSVTGTCIFATITPATGSTSTPTPTPSSNTVSPTVVPPVTGAPTAPVPTDPILSPSTTPDPSTSPNPSPTPGSEKTNAGCQIVSSDLQDGTFEMLLTCDGAVDDLGTLISQTLSFSAIANGYGQLTIDSIQVVGPDSSGPYSVTTGRASYNIGGGSGNVSLDMKLRLQCVVKKPKRDVPVQVRVGLGDGSLQNTVFTTGTFNFDDDGHLVGTVNFDAPAGSGYKVLPKYSMGMQKKVCEATPSEDYPGAYSCDKGNITLQNGSNELDLSNIVLLTGDLPPGEQDGISNAFDQNLIRQLIGKRDEESAALADVNFDGVINAIDHSCMVAALAVRWDEE